MLHVAPSCLVPDEPHAPPPCSGDKGTPADPDDGEKGARGGGGKLIVPPPCKGEPPTSPPPYCITKEKNQEKVWRTEGETWLRLPSDGENECAH
jgi:hypothetical protein